MIGRLSPLLGRTMALALTACVILAAWISVVEPIRSKHREYENSALRSRELIERFNRVGATRNRLQAQVTELNRRARSSGGFLKGASPTLVAANLQNRLKRIVSETGATIRSSQILPVREEGDLKRIALRIQLVADVAALQKILYGLETGDPYLFMDDVNIRAQRKRRRRGKTADARSLTVRIDMYGFLQPEKS